MSETIKQSELRNNNAEMMRGVAAGESFTATVHGHPLLPFDAEVAGSYGLLANIVRQAGRNRRPRRMDLMIAATGVRHGFSLAIRNGADLRHLQRVLHVIDVD